MSTKKDLASGESGSGRVDKRVRVRVRKDGVKVKGAKGAKKTRVRSEKNLEKRNVKKWGKPKKIQQEGTNTRGWRLIISSLKVMLCNQSILILNNSRSLIWDGGGYLWWACWRNDSFLPKTFRGRGRNPYSSYPRVVLMLLEYHPTRKLHHCPIYNVVNHVELVDWPCTRDSNGSVIECSRPTHSSLYVVTWLLRDDDDT